LGTTEKVGREPPEHLPRRDTRQLLRPRRPQDANVGSQHQLQEPTASTVDLGASGETDGVLVELPLPKPGGKLHEWPQAEDVEEGEVAAEPHSGKNLVGASDLGRKDLI